MIQSITPVHVGDLPRYSKIHGATRPTGQIEEEGSAVCYSLLTVHGGVPRGPDKNGMH